MHGHVPSLPYAPWIFLDSGCKNPACGKTKIGPFPANGAVLPLVRHELQQEMNETLSVGSVYGFMCNYDGMKKSRLLVPTA